MILGQKYPPFISQNDFIKYSNYTKAFAKFGLNDCQAKVKASFISDVDKSIHVAKSIVLSGGSYANMDWRTMSRRSKTINILDNISLTKSFSLAKAVRDEDNKVLVRKGAKISTVVERLRELTDKTATIDLKRQFSTIETLSKANNLTVVFSTDPWDIATMSMRGIQSCMRWASSHAPQLIGSILDPYVGVIYITNGIRTKYGASMLYRAVVRIVKDESRLKSREHLFIDKIYSINKEIKNMEHPEALAVFRKFLSDNSKSTTPVLSMYDKEQGGIYIPLSPVVEQLPRHLRSCVDSGIPYLKL